jgi:LacI family transcriptional regulator
MRKRINPSKAPSIKDVAAACGLSISTVSRVINNFDSVKGKNRSKVLEAVKRLKFQPSVFAQRLATGKSNVVALVIPRYEGIFYSFYALELIRGIGTLCSVLKFDLLLHLTDTRAPLNLKGVGGIIFADIIGNKHQLQEALDLGIPLVVVNNYVEDMEVGCIAIDNKGGAEKAVEYLAGLGHKRIAHISGDLVSQAASQRLQGYEQALQKCRLSVDKELIVKTDYSRGQARLAAEKLFTMAHPPTAVFAASDSMALEVMAVARELGKRVPSDLSIVGFDDNPSGLYGAVALTTIRQPLTTMAEESVKKLSLLMSKKKLKLDKTILPTELVVRDSCQAVSPA